MKIDERKALNTQKPNAEKVYESKADTPPRTAKPPATVGQDGVALDSQDQLRLRAMTTTAEETSRLESLTQLVQSGQYEVDPLALSSAMAAAMLKGY